MTTEVSNMQRFIAHTLREAYLSLRNPVTPTQLIHQLRNKGFPMSVSSASHNLKILVDMGLAVKDGRGLYRPADEPRTDNLMGYVQRVVETGVFIPGYSGVIVDADNFHRMAVAFKRQKYL